MIVSRVSTNSGVDSPPSSEPLKTISPSSRSICRLIVKSLVFVNTHRPSPSRVGNNEQEGTSSPSGTCCVGRV